MHTRTLWVLAILISPGLVAFHAAGLPGPTADPAGLVAGDSITSICVATLALDRIPRAATDCGAPNGGFEQCDGCPSAAALPVCWRAYTDRWPLVRVSASTEAARSGAWGVLLDDPARAGSNGIESGPIHVEAGRDYTLSAWFKAAPGASASTMWSLYVNWFDNEAAAGARIGASANPYVLATPDWTQGSLTAVAPEGAHAARLLVYEGHAASGAFYVDDVEMRAGVGIGDLPATSISETCGA